MITVLKNQKLAYEVGTKIADIIIEFDSSVEHVATHLNILPQDLIKIINGQCHITIDLLIKFCERFNRSLLEFNRGSGLRNQASIEYLKKE